MACRSNITALLSSGLILTLLGAKVTSEDQRKNGGTFSLYIENDSIAGTDRNYTSGVKFGWSSADLSRFSDAPAAKPFLPVLKVAPFINGPAFQKNLVLAVGQNIYTPNDTQTTTLTPTTGRMPAGFTPVSASCGRTPLCATPWCSTSGWLVPGPSRRRRSVSCMT